MLKSAAAVAIDYSVPLVIAGDLFDSAKPSPQLIAATMEALEDTDLIIVCGNHDRASSRAGDHALGPLQEGLGATVVEKRLEYNSGGFTAAFFAAGATLEDLAWSRKKSADVVICHAGLSMPDDPPWLHNSKGSLPVSNIRASVPRGALILSGDWHSHKAITDRTVQIGALVPTGWDNPGLVGYGSVILVFPDRTWDRIELAGPRFVDVSSAEELERLRSDSNALIYARRTGEAPRADDEARELVIKPKGTAKAVEAPKAARIGEAVRAATRARVSGELGKRVIREVHKRLGI